jgi:hypothetical protein
MVRPLVEKAALAQAINEAWILIALLTFGALLCVPFAKRSLASSRSDRFTSISPNLVFQGHPLAGQLLAGADQRAKRARNYFTCTGLKKPGRAKCASP